MSRSDRADLAMLALPVALIAFTVLICRWAQPELGLQPIAQVTPGAKRALTGLPAVATPVAVGGPPSVILPQPEPSRSSIASRTPESPPQLREAEPGVRNLAAAMPPDRDVLAPSDAASGTATAVEPDPTVMSVREFKPRPLAATGLPPPQPIPASKAPSQTLGPAPANPELAATWAGIGPAIPAYELPGGVEELAAGLSQCRFQPERRRPALAVSWSREDPESFGLALAAAARSQIEDFVIYNDRYTRLRYPMGDVHPMYGVCTDVIVRAYRVLGIDLQELVQKTKSGSGDPNIDHRRVDTLRRFFSRFGKSLPISSFAEDYRPGDIVTYWRPQNRHSRTHIAVVSGRTAASGRPLIIHNRGWGPQEEDGLFVDQITGHYRFSGLQPPASKAVAAPVRRVESERRPARALTDKPVLPAGYSAPQ